ncbi:MAG: DnaA regulatory inactivator Hda [Steroidobacterales bacterium]
MKQLALPVRLRAEAVFDSFSGGPNAEVVAALRAPGTDPVWLWGARGTGKTHLLQAACAAAGNAAAAYIPLDGSAGLPPEALQGFASRGLLCVDDVDAVAGELHWERMLFQLFNEAVELRTRLIFAAAAPPAALSWALNDWSSRAAACVVYQLRELDDAGRIEALRLRAMQRGLALPPETADYLLRRMPRDLASLLGLLDQLDEASLAAQRRLTIPFIRDALERIAGKPP